MVLESLFFILIFLFPHGSLKATSLVNLPFLIDWSLYTTLT